MMPVQMTMAGIATESVMALTLSKSIEREKSKRKNNVIAAIIYLINVTILPSYGYRFDVLCLFFYFKKAYNPLDSLSFLGVFRFL